jgi:uncharacterized protein CbrC (UPF0167 family)
MKIYTEFTKETFAEVKELTKEKLGCFFVHAGNENAGIIENGEITCNCCGKKVPFYELNYLAF